MDGEDGDGGTQIRTGDTTIFSRVLYQLSYPAKVRQLSNRAVILRRLTY